MDAALDLPALRALALAAAAGDARARAVRRIVLQPEHPDALIARLRAARAAAEAEAAPEPRPDATVDDRWAALLLDLADHACSALGRVAGARLAAVEREGARAVVTVVIAMDGDASEHAVDVPLDPAAGPPPVGLLFDLAQQLLEEGHPIGDG